ncbi:MAG TPA: DUF4058 family protein [Gemmataceae bacterium]|jgi:hypothetical protein|nr:DUF4058 family protein [Gemmataceae bacterium]
MEPDVSVVQPTARRKKRSRRASTALLEKPETEGVGMTMADFVSTEEREPYIEIYQTSPERKLITGIEVLSPSNKRFNSEGWSQYLRKRPAFMKGIANFVEIDLLRGGERMPMKDRWPNSPYYFLVLRKEDAPLCTVWPAYATKRPEAVPIPLAPPDGDVPLQLQPLIESVYVRSHYDDDIDYSSSLNPPLNSTEKAFLKKWHNGRTGRK